MKKAASLSLKYGLAILVEIDWRRRLDEGARLADVRQK